MSTESTGFPSAIRAQLELTYQFERQIGAGGMGVVWLARDRMLDRLVAIKVMRAEVADDSEAAARFLQEARLAARLQHPGIVGLLSFGESAGVRYFVMPYVEGESLASRLARGRLAEPEARRIVAEVAEALSYVHAQGVVHRDIKPANILLERETGAARLTDFGIAKSLRSNRVTSTGMIVGTPTYLAPEQIIGEGAPLDGRADLYALGVVAYELVAGAPPFEGVTANETIARHLADEPAPLASRAHGVSEAYASAVMRCLAKDREARWRSGADLAKALRVADDGDPDPPELRPFRHVLANAVLLSGAVATWGAIPLTAIWPEDATWTMRILTWLLVTTAPLIEAASRLHAGARSGADAPVPWRNALRIGMRVPGWWPAWWPRRWSSPLERVRDLPPRLRAAFRWYQAFMSVAAVHIAMQGVVISAVAALSAAEFARLRSSVPWDVGAENIMLKGPFFLLAIGVGLVVSAWRARALLDRAQRKRLGGLLQHPRTNEAWSDPLVLRLLGAPAVSDPETPPDTLEKLADGVVALHEALVAAGWPLDEISSVVAEVRKARAQWEQEADELRRDVDVAESERLRDRVRSLDALSGPSADQREMRELLRRQLSLQDRQRARLDENTARLERLRAGMALLWRQLRELRAVGVGHRDAGEITGRVRALVEDIERLWRTAEELRRAQ